MINRKMVAITMKRIKILIANEMIRIQINFLVDETP